MLRDLTLYRSLSALALLISVLSGACSTEPELTSSGMDPPSVAEVKADPRFEAIRAEIVEQVKSGSIPSMAIAVSANGTVLWEEAIGWADIEQKIPATPATAYTAASIAKTITALGVMRAIEANALSLDDPAENYLEQGDLNSPWADSREITVKHLMTMTAGLPQGYKMFVPPGRAQTTREMIRNHGGLVGLPIGDFFYSNYSFGVLELVIEGATGKSFDDFMQGELFDPIGMSSTYYEIYGKPNGIEIATNYTAAHESLPPHASGPAGGAGVRTSVHDLIRFAALFADAPIEEGDLPFNPEAIALMRERQLDFDRPLADYGLGVWMRDLDDLYYIIANGHGNGGVSEFLALPDHGIAVASLVNTRDGEEDYPGQFNQKINAMIVDVLVPGFFDQTTDEKVRSWEISHAREDDLIGNWAGAVRDFTGKETELTMTFQQDGDIHVQLGDQYVVLLNFVRENNGVLQGEFSGFFRIDEEHENDHAIILYLKRAGDRLTGFLEANFVNDHGDYGVPNLVWLQREAVPEND